MTEFENYLEREIEDLQDAQGGASVLAADADYVYLQQNAGITGFMPEQTVLFDTVTQAGTSLSYDADTGTITVNVLGLYEVYFEIDFANGSPAISTPVKAVVHATHPGPWGLGATAYGGPSVGVVNAYNLSPLMMRFPAGSAVNLVGNPENGGTADISWAALAIGRVL